MCIRSIRVPLAIRIRTLNNARRTASSPAPMTDPHAISASHTLPRWLHIATVLAAGNFGLQVALSAKPIFLLAALGILAFCAALYLCLNPRFLHPGAVFSVVATFLLLAIGQFVTSFGAGMADPVWPTEPWYVVRTATAGEKAKFREQFGFFIEHTHRIAGWTVGGVVSVLAVGVLWTDPRKVMRWVAIVGLLVLLMGYGEFHRGLMAQREKPAAEVVLPMRAIQTTLAGLAVMLAAVCSGFLTRSRGSGLRLCAVLRSWR